MINFSSLQILKNKLGGRSIYLIGMMGSGKSNTGPYLAKTLDYSFVDVDDLIEKSSGKSISTIFSEDGEENFREIENQVLQEISKYHSLIVATGGGAVTRPNNWGILHQGIVVWLNPGRNQLLKRLQKDSVQRPLLNKDDFEKSFDQIIKERKSFYSECDLEIPINHESPEEVAQMIIDLLPRILTDPEDLSERQTIGF